MRFILATGNSKKAAEMREILSSLGFEAVPQKDMHIDLEPEETGATFMENAVIKASVICCASGLPAIADDSGLMVDALGGEPGVYSKRYGGGGLDDSGLCAYLLKKMENKEHREAKFVSSIVCVFPDGAIVSATGECAGEILRVPRGNGGFGYDPVFLVAGTEKSMAEMSATEKNAVSHRGAALREFAAALRDFLKNKEWS